MQAESSDGLPQLEIQGLVLAFFLSDTGSIGIRLSNRPGKDFRNTGERCFVYHGRMSKSLVLDFVYSKGKFIQIGTEAGKGKTARGLAAGL